MIINDLVRFSPLLTQYTELRSQENRVLAITYLKGNLTQNSKNTTGGLSARVLRNGCWGFASSPQLSDVRAVLAAATENATFLDARENKGLAPFAPDSPVVSRSFGTTRPRLSQKQIMDFIKEIDAYIAQKYPTLSSRTISSWVT